ncbi:DUF881 domain-containing protein [Dermacoccaceae bacterium W4C1]
MAASNESTEPESTEPESTDPEATGPKSTEPEPTEPAAPMRSFWSLRFTRANVLATLLTALLGFAVATQVHHTRASGLENLRQNDLVAVLGNVNNQSTRLQGEIADLTRTRDQLRSGSGAAAESAARERLSTLGILAGTVKAQGTGVVITIPDPDGAVGAPKLLDAIQELRDAGAEAIQVNTVRVIASTWFATDSRGRLVVDGSVITSPITITAIGDASTMGTAMAIPGGVVESLQQLGVTATVSERSSVEVTALRRVSQARYAQPDTDGE